MRVLMITGAAALILSGCALMAPRDPELLLYEERRKQELLKQREIHEDSLSNAALKLNACIVDYATTHASSKLTATELVDAADSACIAEADDVEHKAILVAKIDEELRPSPFGASYPLTFGAHLRKDAVARARAKALRAIAESTTR